MTRCDTHPRARFAKRGNASQSAPSGGHQPRPAVPGPELLTEASGRALLGVVQLPSTNPRARARRRSAFRAAWPGPAPTATLCPPPARAPRRPRRMPPTSLFPPPRVHRR